MNDMEKPKSAAALAESIRRTLDLYIGHKPTFDSLCEDINTLAKLATDAATQRPGKALDSLVKINAAFETWVDEYPCQIIGDTYDYCQDAFNAGRASVVAADFATPPSASASQAEPVDAFPALQALTEAILTRADNDYMDRQIDAAVKVMASRGWTTPVPWPRRDEGHPMPGLATQARPASGEAWKSILTAPEGEAVLVASEFDGPGDWRIKAGYLNGLGTWIVWGASWTPTHWMPLPAAPSATQEERPQKLACSECGQADCNGQCFGDDMMGD